MRINYFMSDGTSMGITEAVPPHVGDQILMKDYTGPGEGIHQRYTVKEITRNVVWMHSTVPLTATSVDGRWNELVQWSKNMGGVINKVVSVISLGDSVTVEVHREECEVILTIDHEDRNELEKFHVAGRK